MAIHKIADQRNFEFRLETDIFDYGIAEYLDHSTLLVYIALCHHAQRDQNFPLISQLMAECALDKRTIENALQLLEKNHLIKITHQQDHKIYAVQSVREAIQYNGWPKLEPADMPCEEPEISETEFLLNLNTAPTPEPEPPFDEPVPPSPTDTPIQPAAAKPSITTITTESCPYCNERGLIEYARIRDGKVRYMPCDHNPVTIKGEALKREAEIGTIREGYKQPVDFSQLKIKLGLMQEKEEKKEGSQMESG